MGVAAKKLGSGTGSDNLGENWSFLDMLIRMIELPIGGRNLLCPFVVCERCDGLIQGSGVVLVRVAGHPAFHEECASRESGQWMRSLDEFLSQIQTNSKLAEDT